MLKGFIPSTKKEVDDLGWKKPDVIIVTGDAYIDHPYFQVASAGRFLNSKGIRTAILDMPELEKSEDWNRLGKPGLFFLVITGKEDSMAMNYTAFKKFRSTDPYIPGGKRTHRPDRAAIKYCNKLKELFKDIPIILTGTEAVCRMATHYDYWTDKIRKPILFDTKADMLLFGNIEHNLLKICELMKSKQSLSEVARMNGMAYISKDISDLKNFVQIPSHESIEKNLNLLIDHHLRIHKNQNPYNSSILVQRAVGRYLVIHKSQLPMTQEETDEIFNTGFKKRPHPKYRSEIPIDRFINDVIITHRGCLNDVSDSQDIFTEGKFISSRSNEHIRKEVIGFIKSKEYNKILRIFGLPYFNQYLISLGNQKVCSTCERLSCTLPGVCSNIKPKTEEILKIIEGFDKFPNVRNNFYAGKPDMKLLVSEKEMYKDYITNRNDGNIELPAGSFSSSQRSLMGLDDSDSIIKDIKFLIKRAGEYGKKISFSIDISAGYPAQTDDEVDFNIKNIKESTCSLGNINNFVPLPLTLSGIQYFLGIDPLTGKELAVDKKLSTMKKHNEWYKKIRKDKK